MDKKQSDGQGQAIEWNIGYKQGQADMKERVRSEMKKKLNELHPASEEHSIVIKAYHSILDELK